MSFPRYPSYRSSNVRWLGVLPDGWTAEPLKRCLAGNDGGAWGDEPDGVDDTIVLRSTEQTVDGDWAIDDPALRALSQAERAACTLKVNDLLMTKSSGSALHIGKTTLVTQAVADLHCCYSNFMQRLRCHARVEPRFAWYLLNSDVAREQFGYVSNSTTGLSNLSAGSIGEIVVPLPSSYEQKLIVAFLDGELAKLNGLIAEQERLNGLLREKRQTIISHVVTKGLDPKVPMKDSGVEWLGEIPATWGVRSMSSLSTKITNGYVGPTRDILVEEGVRYLQSLHIKANRVMFDVPYFVAEEWSRQHSKSILDTGDVLIVQTGDIGQVAVVSEEFAGCNCHALIVVAPIREVVRGEWLAWVLNSDYGRNTLLSIQTGALHPHLNCGNVKGVRIPLPKLQEQDRIVEYIEAELSRCDELIAEVLNSAELLRERRSALISAAVTGKIDVRGLAPAVQEAA